jgi:hypothetical protein
MTQYSTGHMTYDTITSYDTYVTYDLVLAYTRLFSISGRVPYKISGRRQDVSSAESIKFAIVGHSAAASSGSVKFCSL